MVTSIERGRIILVIRRRTDLYVGIFVIVVCFLMINAYFSAPVFLGHRALAAVLAGVMCILAWLDWAFVVRSRVVVWESGVEVFNGFIYYWIPWPAIDSAAYKRGAAVQLKDGRLVRPLSTMGAPISVLFGNRHQRGISDLLEEYRRSADSGESVDAKRRSNFHLLSLIAFTVAAAILKLLSML